MHANTSQMLVFLVTWVAGVAAATAGSFIVVSDRTVTAGVDYLHWDGVYPLNPQLLQFYHMCAGAAAGDFDGDGWCDLYVTRVNAPNRLFRNRGDGTFEDVAAAAGVDLSDRCSGCAWVDVDNDGWLDLLVLTYGQGHPNYLYMNNGDGTFREEGATRGVNNPATERYTSSVAVGDYDLDGDLDLVVMVWFGTNGSRLLRNDGTGHFEDVTIAAKVFEGDDTPTGPTTPQVFAWSGGFADLTGDGYPELLVAADFLTSRIYLNHTNGTFENVTAYTNTGTDENGMGSAIADYDGDGDFDWFVTSIYDPNTIAHHSWGSSGNRMYRQISPMVFRDRTNRAGVRDGSWGWGAAFVDMDNDGDLDLAMTNGVDLPATDADAKFHDDRANLWENDGVGRMTNISVAAGYTDRGQGKGLLTWDYDRDGRVDIFIANNADHPVLYHNDSVAGHWLRVELRGSVTNSFGLGAIVQAQISPGGPWLTRTISGQSHFMAHSELAAYFGLGDAQQVHRLRVRWPVTGQTQVLEDIAADQSIRIAEPCPGDIDGDGTIAIPDLQRLLIAFGLQTADGLAGGDIDGDGRVMINDLGTLLRNFGATCR